MKSKSRKRVKLPKKIEIKDRVKLQIYIQNSILQTTNAGLISLELHFAVRKFIGSLKEIYLSEELQELT